jgi:hypothetical protein
VNARRYSSNAERQRAYRNRKRGGQPVGRWPGRSTADMAKQAGLGRTTAFMFNWLSKHAPDALSDFYAGRAKISTAYRRLRKQMLAEHAEICHADDRGQAWAAFMAKWCPGPQIEQ